MVRALLAGTKTQTRRIVKPQPELTDRVGFTWKGFAYGLGLDRTNGTARNFTDAACPYGRALGRLWVRETWTPGPIFAADGCDDRGTQRCMPMDKCVRWRPSIHMPRVISRITLEITDVRVERLQDISEEDAEAEGIERNSPTYGSWDREEHGWIDCMTGDEGFPAFTPRDAYASLWESINGPGSWNLNPWVWVVGFKRVQP